ncbi:MAG: VTT domain-containing protein [bacterium]|nr:VTT domain-containing protein [bacterium]
MGKKQVLVNTFWFFLVLGIIYISISYLGVNDIREKVEVLGVWGPIVLIMAKASTLVFAPLGGAPLYPVAGALFGTLHGFIYVMIGDAIGSALCFFISRRFGRKIVRYFMSGPGMQIVERLLGHMGTVRGFIETRFFFIGFPEAVSYAAGLTRLPFVAFITINTLMYVIPNLAYVWVGDAVVALNPLYAGLYMLCILSLAAGGGAILWRRARKFAPEVASVSEIISDRTS